MLLGLKRDERREDGVEKVVYPQEVSLFTLITRETREMEADSSV